MVISAPATIAVPLVGAVNPAKRKWVLYRNNNALVIVKPNEEWKGMQPIIPSVEFNFAALLYERRVPPIMFWYDNDQGFRYVFWKETAQNRKWWQIAVFSHVSPADFNQFLVEFYKKVSNSI